MAEQILPVFVFAATFIGVSAILLAAMASFLMQSSYAYWDDLEASELIGGREYENNTVTPGWGYNITSLNVTNDIDDTDQYLFYETWNTESTEDDRAIYVKVVIGSVDYNPDPPWYWDSWDKNTAKYENFVYLKSHRGWTMKYEWISLDKFKSKRTNETVSAVDFKFTKNTKKDLYSVILETNSTAQNHTMLIDSGYFNLKVAVPIEPDSDVATASMWTLLGQIFTGSIPDVDSRLNRIIQLPVLAAFGFMAFTIISRVIPFIAGG